MKKTGLQFQQEREKEMAALLKSCQVIFQLQSFEEAAKTIFQSCKGLIGAPAGYVALMTPDGRENDVVYLDAGGRECLVDPDLPMPIRGLREKVSRTGKTVYENNFRGSEWQSFLPERHITLENVLFAPLMLEGKVVGLLGLGNKPGGFTQEDARRASSFGEHAAVALRHYRTLDKLKRREEELRRAHCELDERVQARTRELIEMNEVLRKRERQLAESQKIAHIGSWEWNIRQDRIFWSDELYRMFGVDREDFEATFAAFLHFVHPDDREKLECAVNASLAEGAPYHVDVRIRRSDGREWIMEARGIITYDELGEPRLMGGVAQDITERKETENALRSSHEELRELTVYLQSVREEERSRIAREIHDELGQTLTALRMDLAWLKKKVPPEESVMAGKIASMDALLSESLQTVRKISADLRPGILDDLGLTPALKWLAGEWQERTGIACEVRFDPAEIDPDPERSTALFRIVQEALTNVVRHAGATRVRVALKWDDAGMTLQIVDNGGGIPEEASRSPRSFGLIGMRERVHAFGGKMKIEGIPGRGTTLAFRFPPKEEVKS